MKTTFDREKIKFYSKVMPVITITLGLLFIACIVMNHAFNLGTFNYVTDIVNGIALLLFIILTILTRKFSIANWFVCPLLTIFIFYYTTFVDYDGVNISIFYTMVIGITISFFLLVILTEQWIISSVSYAPCLAYYMYKTG